MYYTAKELSEIIGVSDTLVRNYLCLAEFEKKRVKKGQGSKLIYDLTNSDIKLLESIITARVRWYRKSKETEQVKSERN